MSGSRGIGVWQGPFLGASEKVHLELTAQDENVLSRLQRGERGKGINLERINGAREHVVTIRPDKKRRLFLWMEHDKIIVIHIMTNHKHNRVPDEIKNFIFDGQPAVALNYEKVDEVKGFTPDPNFKLKEIKSAACYNQSLIVYDNNQENILDEKLPVLLHGDFGSGKSALARSMLIKMIEALKDSCPDKDFVYYSHLPDLVRHMFDMFLLDNPTLATVIDINRIKFLDTLGLVREYGPAELANKKPVGLNEFKQYLMQQYQNELSQMPFIDIHADIDVLYDEFQIIVSLEDDEAYLTLGAQASNYSQPDLRAWLVKVAQNYCKRMRDNSEFDPCVTLWQPESPPLAFLVGDEMQGAPLAVIKMIPFLVYGRKNIMLCGDSNQSERRLSVLPRLKTFFNEAGASLTVRVMPGSYRSPLHMMPLLNAVISAKQWINHGLNDKDQASSVESKLINQCKSHGGIEWVNFSDYQSLKARLDEKGTVYVVMTHEAYIGEARKHFGEDVPVYTPRKARGMEFEVVVFYRLLDEPLLVKNKQAKPRLLSEVLNPFVANMPENIEPAKHQPKQGKANPIYEPKLNDWVIALSRLVGKNAHCFMLEVPNPKKAGHLQALIQAGIKKGQALIEQGDNHLAVGTQADWEALALKNIEAGNREQALVAYKRLGKTEQALDADIKAYHERRQARVDHVKKGQSTQPANNRRMAVANKTAPVDVPRPEQNTVLENTSLTQSPPKSKKVDDIVEKRQAILALLGKEKNTVDDFEKAINILPVEHWVDGAAPVQPLFLTVISSEKVAKEWCAWMMRVCLDSKKTKKTTPTVKFIKALFGQMQWLASDDEKDESSSRLRWMVEDGVRLMIFKNGIELLGNTPLIGFDTKEACLKLCGSYKSPARPGDISSLLGVIAMKQLDLLLQIFSANPILSSDLRLLFSVSVINGQKMSVIGFFLSRKNESELNKLDKLLEMHNEKLYSEMMILRSKKPSDRPPFDEADMDWCISMICRREARYVLVGRSLLVLSHLFKRKGMIELFNTVMNNQKKFIENIMLDEEIRTSFFDNLALFLKEAQDDPLKLQQARQLRAMMLPYLNQHVPLSGRMAPLIFCIFWDLNREKLLDWLEGDNHVQFYKEEVKLEHLTKPYYMPNYKAPIPIIYFLARVCSPRLVTLFCSTVLDGLTSNYWLDLWKTNQSEGESILSALVSQLSAFPEVTIDKLRVVDVSLGALLTEGSGRLLLDYAVRYADGGMALPAEKVEVSKLRTLYDVCFYLAWALDGAMRRFVTDKNIFMMDALPLPLWFDRVSMKSQDMPLFFYAIHHKEVRQKMLLYFQGMALSARQPYLNVLYQALVRKNITETSTKEYDWSALVHLAVTASGLDFLCELMLMFPGLGRQFKMSDFTYPFHKIFPTNAAVDKMMANQQAFMRFLNAMARDNLTLYGEFLAALTRMTEENSRFFSVPSAVTAPLDAQEEASPLQTLGLFGGALTASPPRAPSPLFDINDAIIDINEPTVFKNG